MAVRVLTWNLWWRFGPWEQRQEPIARTLAAAAPDVVCLQEVFPADDDGPDQAARLADRLGFHAATSLGPDRPWMGNAVLSRWPLSEIEVQTLPAPAGRREFRTALHAVADAPDGPIPVTSTHLTWEYDQSATRVAQARALAIRIAERHERLGAAFPPVLCGDLNATPDSDELRLLTGRAAVARKGLVFVDSWPAVRDEPGYTWHRDNPHLAEATWPQRRLDYVLVGWPRQKPRGQVLACDLVGDVAVDGVVPSDHYGVVSELAT